MKSIKQQYLDLKEGKMSQFNFMRNLRMTMPHLVNNSTPFNTAVKILQNKGILVEIGNSALMQVNDDDIIKKGYEDFQMEIGKNPFEPDTKEFDLWNIGWSKAQKEDFGDDYLEDDEDNIDHIPGSLAQKEKDFLNSEEDEDFPNFHNDNEIAENINEIKNRISSAQAHPQELNMGRKVEMEHTDNPEVAERIALDHLTEDPFYYTKLNLAGLADEINNDRPKAKKSKQKRSDLPTIVGKDNFVDKANQMKTPKGVVKAKASANKAKKETNKTTGKITLMSLVAVKPRGVEKMAATGEKMKKIVIKESQKNPEEEFLINLKNFHNPPFGKISVEELVNLFSKIDLKKRNKILKYLDKINDPIMDDDEFISNFPYVQEEVNINLFSDEQPNEIVKQTQQFIESNPTLNQISDKIVLHNSGDDACVVKYEYWEEAPKEALDKLNLQFNVEREVDDGDDDTAPRVYYILKPKPTQNKGLGMNTLKEMIQEELFNILSEEENNG